MTASPNQCDGCQRGLPLKDGRHEGPGGFRAGDVQVCTADRYAKCPDCKGIDAHFAGYPRLSASPALLTKEHLAAITRRVQSSHERGDDAGPIAVDRRLLLQHIAALEQRVALLERHNGFLRDWCRDPAEVRKIIESALPKELR